MISIILIGVSAAALIALAGRHHIIVLEDSLGRYYAVGVVDPDRAREFISKLLRGVAREC